MSYMRKFVQFGLLATLVLAINVFCLVKCLHERHPMLHHTGAHNMQSQRGTSRNRLSATGQSTQGDHADAKFAPKLKPTVDLSAHLALPSQSLQRFAPQFVSAPLAERPVLSLGSAARAPGAPRGPPSNS